VVGLLLLIAAASVIPRLVALRGVPHSAQLVFGDMPLHLLNLEKELKTWTVGYSSDNTPYFGEAPQDLQRHNFTRWPPGVYKVALPLARLFGPLSIWTTQLTNLLFLGVMVLGLFLLGRTLGSTRLGLWAALLAVLCPPLAGASWYLTLDFPLAAMVTLCLALLLGTDNFRHTGRTLLFAVAAALALYTKLTFPLYLLFPCLVCLALGLARGPRRGRIMLNLLMALGVVAGLSALLGNFDLRSYLGELGYHAVSDAADEALPEYTLEMGSLSWVLAVGRMMVNSYTLPLSLLAAPGLVMLLTRAGRQLPHRWALVGFIGGAYLIFTLISAKMERYSQPLYPLLCLLTVWWIMRWVPRRWRLVGLTWAAAAFAAMLWLSHVRPLPWTAAPAQVVDRAMFYDNRPPTASELAGLRRLKYHPTCDLGPLLTQMKQLSRRLAPRRVLSVTFPSTPKDEIAGEPDLTYDTLASIVTQQFPERLVINAPMRHEGMPPPYTFFLHEIGAPAAARFPRMKLLAREVVMVDCGAPRPMALSLLARSEP